MIKGKILFIVSLLIALLLTAVSAGSGYVAATLACEQFAQTLVSYDWDLITIAISAACGLITLLVALPNVIVARQVCRMYNVSRKYAKWSPVTITVGTLMLLLTGGAIGYVCYALNQIPAALWNMLVTSANINLNILSVQIACGAVIFLYAVLLFVPLLVSLRMRDGVSALLRKKRNFARSDAE